MAKYINDKRFTDEVIEKILTRCGLIPTEVENQNKGSEVVPAITRGEKLHMVRCKNTNKDDGMDFLYKYIPMLKSLGRYGLGQDIELVAIEDFYISRLKISEDIEDLDRQLFDVFYDEMKEIFGEEWEIDAHEYFDNLRKEEQQSQNEEERQA